MSEKKDKKPRTFHQDYSNLMMEANKLSKTEGNPFFKSKYVPLKDVLSEAKKVCLSNNFIFIQVPKLEKEGAVLETRLKHLGGDTVTGKLPLVRKDLTDPQKLGGSLTYMRRYSLTTMLGIQEDDDDANKISKKVGDTHTNTKIIQNPKVDLPFVEELKPTH